METAQQYDTKITSAKTILLDIEGTTTSKSFVKDVLFPYASENVSSFLTSNWETEDVKSVVKALRELASKEKSECVEGCIEIIEEDENNREAVINAVVENIKWQMSFDRKTGPLKTLQGLIWEKGYKDGTIKGHVYDDVPEAFSNWSASGHKLYIYSSGSVAAQKLLFANSEKGNLLDKISGQFDTAVGGKQDVDSYKNIIKEIGCDQVLFLTDIVKEANAALEAGMAAVLVQRDVDTTFTDEEKEKHTIIKSFADLPLTNVSGKRKSIDKDEELHPAKLAKIDEQSEEASEELSKKTTEDIVESSTMETDDDKTEKPVAEQAEKAKVESETAKSESEIERKETEVKADTESIKEEKEVVKPDTKTEVVKQDMEVSTDADKPEETEKEDQKENNEVEVMEVDSAKPSSVSEEVQCVKSEQQCDSTDTKEVKEATEVVPTTMDSAEKQVENPPEKVVEEVTVSEVDSTKIEVTVEDKTTEKKTIEENEAETKIEENGISAENDSLKTEEGAPSATAENVEITETTDVDVTSSDNKIVDQVDHTLKESNGLETNETNGTKIDVVEGNGEAVESSTNGTDSDKENDKEAEGKSENGTNGSTNGLAEEIVKVKKLPAESSPVPAAPVEETSA